MMARKLDLLDDVQDVAGDVRVGVLELMCTLAGVLRDLKQIGERCEVARRGEALSVGRPRKAPKPAGENTLLP